MKEIALIQKVIGKIRNFFFNQRKIMDKEIKAIEKDVKKISKGSKKVKGIKKVSEKLKTLKKIDKKRDPACEAGAKMMKKKK